MAKSKKTVDEIPDVYAESCMRWDCGQEVDAYLWWDERRYYLWFVPTDNFIDWCEENSEIAYLLDALYKDLDKLGVQEFYDLDSVNEFCRGLCGDDDPAYFYEDELCGVCGA